MSAVAIALVGSAAVLVLDTAGSLAARRFGFRYALLTPLSFAIYAATGFLAARAGGSAMAGATAGAAAAAVDATVGRRISRAAGVDDLEDVTPGFEMGVATMVTLTGAAIGGAAGLVA
jgi:hypothetical protein